MNKWLYEGTAVTPQSFRSFDPTDTLALLYVCSGPIATNAPYQRLLNNSVVESNPILRIAEFDQLPPLIHVHLRFWLFAIRIVDIAVPLVFLLSTPEYNAFRKPSRANAKFEKEVKINVGMMRCVV
jgi:hypothetical protein